MIVQLIPIARAAGILVAGFVVGMILMGSLHYPYGIIPTMLAMIALNAAQFKR